jgi:hypothetical protein
MGGMKAFLPALRGLALGLSISVVNLFGVFLALLVLGGLGEWTPMQFVGMFGLFEIATAIAFVFAPNIWRLPVMEAETSDRTTIRLAASVTFIPHWAGAAKAIAGVVMVGIAGWSEGLSPASLGLIPVAAATAVFVLGVSALVARWGVARPDLDVVTFVVLRPKHEDRTLPGISISSSLVQIVVGTINLPVVLFLPPSALYQPEFAPSPAFLVGTVVAAVVSVVAALIAWRGRISRSAPRAQQRNAEQSA